MEVAKKNIELRVEGTPSRLVTLSQGVMGQYLHGLDDQESRGDQRSLRPRNMSLANGLRLQLVIVAVVLERLPVCMDILNRGSFFTLTERSSEGYE